MIRIKAYIMGLNDQCSWYRGAGPLNRLQSDFDDVRVDYCTRAFSMRDWHEVSGYDAFFILRPFTEEHFEMIACANSCSVPVIADYDDDFFYTGGHPWLKHVRMHERHDIIKACLERCTLVILSTHHLVEVYKPFCKQLIHIPNGFDSKTLAYQLQYVTKRSNVVAWRGSDTHDSDLLPISEDFISVMNENEDWESQFFWGHPKFITYRLKHFKQAALSPTGFFYRLYKNAPKILMHPLKEDSFNIGKSNAAWIEGTMAGAMVLSADLPEWRARPNSFVYNSSEDFKNVLRVLMKMSDDDQAKFVEAGQKFILEKLELGILNTKRRAIFASLK